MAFFDLFSRVIHSLDLGPSANVVDIANADWPNRDGVRAYLPRRGYRLYVTPEQSGLCSQSLKLPTNSP